MGRKVTVVVSQGQSNNPVKRELEEGIVATLMIEAGVDVTVVHHLYDLAPDGTGVLCLSGVAGDMIVLSWLYPRAAHWILARNGILGRLGTTLLDEDFDDAEEEDEDSAEKSDRREGELAPEADAPHRTIYHIDFRSAESVEPFVEEIQRIARETSVETVDLTAPLTGRDDAAAPVLQILPAAPQAAPNENGDEAPGLDTAVGPLRMAMDGGAGGAGPTIVEESTTRRWYPVIDSARCTNCLECLDFCLFGVYGVDAIDTILVEQPDNCRKGCPACSRVCPENAIIFPQHKTPAIAGSPVSDGGGFKIDLSKLFGGGDALGVAVQERDQELVAAGRESVGVSVGLPKRQQAASEAPPDELDALVDDLDALDL